MDTTRHISLFELQQRIGNTLRLNRELQDVWVLAELSDVRVNGGHCYMELVEKDASGVTRAKVRAMIWSSRFSVLRRKFRDETGREIESGLKVLLLASVTHHNLYGLSVTVSDIDSSYTLGEMERVRREILDRLAREGVLDANKRRELTEVPRTVAVISAPGAAGYGDFMNQIRSESDGFVLYTVLFPAVMQGANTAPSVLAALDLVEQTIDVWDCVVIIRGGGATTDLNGFDNYELARRVATFGIPVIVGIGHERDRTVLDEIAGVRCKTPTAVAAFLVDRLREAYSRITTLVTRIGHYGADALRGERGRLANAEAMIPLMAKTRLAAASGELERLCRCVCDSAGRRVQRADSMLDRIDFAVCRAAGSLTEKEELRLRRIGDMVRVLSPENTLRRGYSITRLNGAAVKDAAVLRPGDLLETIMAGGIVRSEVIAPADIDAGGEAIER